MATQPEVTIRPNGAFALFGNNGANNTASGFDAMFGNTENGTTGSNNTANGAFALHENDGANNTASGFEALFSNTTGGHNSATGVAALRSNTIGSFNTGNGGFALFGNTTGCCNTATGFGALFSNTTGIFNTANGDGALRSNTTGNNNVALGNSAGSGATTGSGNVYIGVGVQGVAGESSTCYIASIFGQTSANGIPVLINSSDKLGTATSSKRFKKDIKPMDRASEALFSLKPVTFRYKKEIDPASIPQFGLVAEDVEKLNPDLVVRDMEGKAYTVRYEAVNAMLLNEFLKEHRQVQEQKATIVELKSAVAQQQKQIEALSAGLQKVSAQLEANKPVPQVANNP
ncbi:MAG TPA: tail fiber domain-containing protein [Candidatus Udaeobacter sp.]|nr:tail fiber domain-containing protein [Candidatus Udaeobacter sp.]